MVFGTLVANCSINYKVGVSFFVCFPTCSMLTNNEASWRAVHVTIAFIITNMRLAFSFVMNEFNRHFFFPFVRLLISFLPMYISFRIMLQMLVLHLISFVYLD